MKKIGLAVGAEFEDVTVEDKLLADCLRTLGLGAQRFVWDEPRQTSGDFEAVVIHSCWGYHKKPQAFLDWIDGLETKGVQVFNSPQILHWNHDKIYLRELARRGVKIPPTVWIARGETGNLTKILAENNWQKAVLKPTVSATAWRTFIVTPENAKQLQPEFKKLLGTGGAMIQKFVEEIETRGEWSFVFFDKKFSHAVLKRAKTGDFRVQYNFGGTIETDIETPLGLIEAAQKIVSGVGGDLSYARVDGVDVDGKLSLMELELIEPLLFLENKPSAAEKFAAAIAGRLNYTK